MNNNNINSDNDDIYYEFQSTLNFSKIYKLNLLLLNNSKNSEINQTKYLQLINSIFPSKNNKFNTLFNLIFSRFKSLKCDLINEQNTYYITKISDENTINIYNLCCALIIFIKKDFEHKLKYLFKLSDLDSDNLINEFELIKLIQTLNILFCEEICTIKTESTILAQSLIEIKIKEILNLILYEPANLKKIFLKDFYIDFQTLLNRISKINNYKFILFPCFVNMKKCLNTKRNEKKIVINKFLKNDFFKINSDLSRNVKLNKNYLINIYTKNEIKIFNENENELKKNNYDIQISPELKINVESLYDEKQGETNVLFATDSKEKLVLHWGVYTDAQKDKWYHPDYSCYPQNTVEFDDFALQTDFAYLDEGDDEQKIRMKIPKDKGVNTLNFVFFEKNKNVWHNNNMQDYHLNLN